MKKPGYNELENRIKHLEEKLKGIELQRLWNVYAQNPIPTLIVSKEGNFVEYNDAMAELTGYTQEEVPDINAWMPKIYPDEEYRNKVMEISRKSRHREIKVKRDEFIITRKDGKKRYVEFSVFDIMHEGKPVDLQVVQAIDITERKKAEEELRESEERYKIILDAITSYVYSVSIENGKPVETIHDIRCIAITGYSPDDYYNDPNLWINIVPEEDRDLVKKQIDQVFSQKETTAIEHRIIRKDGEVCWVCSTLVPFFNNEGKLISYDGIIEDITERKKAEDSLKYRVILENIVNSISTKFINIKSHDVDSGIDYSLQKIGEFAGIDRSYVFLLSEDETTMDNTHEWCAEGIEPQISKLQGIPTDIMPWWMERLNRFENIIIPRVADLPHEASVEKESLQAQDIKSLVAVPMTYGNSLVGFLGFDSVREEKTWKKEDIEILRTVGNILANTLERKKAEEALRESEERLSTILNCLHAGIVIIDAEKHEIIDANPIAVKMIGTRKKDIVGKICHKFICPAEIGKCPITDLGQSMDNSERELINSKGEIVSILKTVTSVMINGRHCLVNSFIDITERKKAEEERLQREKLRGVLEMAGAASHELTQPMQAISGYSELLLMNMPEDNPLCEELTIIKKQIERMAKITTKLQNITKYETKDYLKRKIIDIDKASSKS